MPSKAVPSKAVHIVRTSSTEVLHLLPVEPQRGLGIFDHPLSLSKSVGLRIVFGFQKQSTFALVENNACFSGAWSTPGYTRSFATAWPTE